MKALKFQSRLRDDLTLNYDICSSLTKNSHPLTYEQMIYAIHNQRISMKQIMYYKIKKYRNQDPSMRRTFLINDAVELSGEVVGKAWRFSSSDRKQGSLEKQKGIVSKKRQGKVQFFTEIPQNQNDDKDNEKQVKTERKQGERQKDENQVQNSKQSDPPGQEINSKKQKLNQRQRSSNPEIPTKYGQLNGKNFFEKQKQKQEIRSRITQVQNQMEFLQADMNSTRNEEQAAKIQKQYQKLTKQLLQLRNRKRFMKEKHQMERIRQSAADIAPEVLEVIESMNCIKEQGKKILKKEQDFQQKISKTEEISRLKMIYHSYSKMQKTSNTKYFSDLQVDLKKLPKEIFIKFAQDWKLNRIIQMDLINKLFKHRSKGKKTIQFGQFVDILNDIHNYQCIKEEKQFNAASLSAYLQNYIVCKEKMGKITNNNQNKKEKKAYVYKARSHSGKYLADIQADLQQKKIKLEFLACKQNIDSINKKIKENERKNKYNPTQNQPKINLGENTLTIMKSTQQLLKQSSNSYAFRFKSKKNSNQRSLRMRMKTQGLKSAFMGENQSINTHNQLLKNQNTVPTSQQVMISDTQQIPQGSYMQDGILFTNQGGKMQRRKKDPNFEQFEDLIELSEEDEYLNKHLMLPPINQSKKLRHKSIHY